jgi:hypothetical protein
MTNVRSIQGDACPSAPFTAMVAAFPDLRMTPGRDRRGDEAVARVPQLLAAIPSA